MEKYCEPLYRCDPSVIPHHLPTLLQAIRLTFITSRYYNTTANVTAILVKISNQMINSCKSYISCENTKTVWGQPKKVILEKIKVKNYFYPMLEYSFSIFRRFVWICI